MFQQFINFVRDYYKTEELIPLHAPVFAGNERRYVMETIDSTFVSSVGAFVERFETDMARYTNSPKAVATMNGTAALHIALRLAGVGQNDLVLTQPLTFVATCNAIAYCGAEPVFLDVDRHTMGLSPSAIRTWLESEAQLDAENVCRHKATGRAIRACLPMHTFGHPVDINGLVAVCEEWNIVLVEDAAESLGSLYEGRHTGTFGKLGTLSFNGNKILTTGGGGMILAGAELGTRAKHITTTAKKPHAFEYVHDELGFNYRLPNLNAALGCAQLEQLEAFVEEKRALALLYSEQVGNAGLQFFQEPEGCRSNYWLNAVVCEDRAMRDAMLNETNGAGVMTRPIWQLMNRLPMFSGALAGDLRNAEWLEARVVNVPSSIVAPTKGMA